MQITITTMADVYPSALNESMIKPGAGREWRAGPFLSAVR
jgi:hypothetical protein